MSTSESESADWLDALEQKISAVTSEVADLRKKNRSLLSKISRLERKARDTPAADDKESAELKSRVEKLVERLQNLLEQK